MRELPVSSRRGTQSIERAIGLLREISTRGHLGLQLSELAARCQLTRSTTHRMLDCLIQERMVTQRRSDFRYIPGPMLFELGLALPELSDLQFQAAGRLEWLSQVTPGVASLLFRSGDDLICAVRTGKVELKSLSLLPGARHPLVATAGGAAIILALPRAEARALVSRNFASLRRMRYARAGLRAIRAMLEHTHAEDFAIDAGYTSPGVNVYGLALRDANGDPYASISLEGSSPALALSRLPQIRSALQALAGQLLRKP